MIHPGTLFVGALALSVALTALLWMLGVPAFFLFLLLPLAVPAWLRRRGGGRGSS